MNRAIAQSLLEGRASLQLSAPVVWKRKFAATYFEIPLRNSLGQSLKLVGQVLAAKPQTVRYLIHDGSGKANNAARLCVRGMHYNKHTDRRTWAPGSHLHSWRVECGDRHADDPHADHWPPANWDEGSLEPLEDTDLEDLFERFCRMLEIEIPSGQLWANRPPQPDTFVLLPDGEEIP